MKYDPMTPIWLQVATELKREIVTGKIPPGEKLPGGRDLALQYEINPNTAARIYQELEREGICETRRGMGTYVTPEQSRIDALRKGMASGAARRFLRELRGMGISLEEGMRLMKEEEEQEYAQK